MYEIKRLNNKCAWIANMDYDYNNWRKGWFKINHEIKHGFHASSGII